MEKIFFNKAWRIFVISLILIGLFGQPASVARAAPAGLGTGLYAVYTNLNSTTVTKEVLAEGPINHGWNNTCPDSNMYQNVCGVWADIYTAWTTHEETLTGYIEAPATGSYTFHASIDDYLEITINGQTQIVDNLGGAGYNITMTLTEGQFVPIRMYFKNRMGSANLCLQWTKPDSTTEIVPTMYLYNSLLNPPPPPLPSSFYGEVRFSDSPPIAGNALEAYLPGVIGPAATATIVDTAGVLTYSIIVPGDTDGTAKKEGGLPGELITFKINGRVVATATWQSSTDIQKNLHPPQAVPGGPYNGNEGAAINFSGSATDWGTDATTYQWDWDNNGTYDTAGQTPGHTWPDNGAYTVGLKVTDAQGGEGTATVQVTVNNVAPTLTISGANTVNEGSAYTLNLSATDPGTDTISGWSIDWGHGSPQAVTGNPASVTHTYPDGPNTYTITATATDEDGTYNANSKSVTVNNVTPTVTRNNATVIVNEGQAAANTGTYADPGDDTVTLGASVGTVTDAGGGAWTWSFATTDGPAQDQTVTITATDSDSAAGTATFTLTVNNVAPTATFNAPASVAEGSAINPSLTAPSDPSSVDTTAGFQYAFDCGAGYGAWSSISTAACPTTDDGSRTVKGKIKDKDNGETEYTATVTITNVLPVANAGGPYTGLAGAAVPLSGAASTCASVDTCTYAWDLDNDGQYDDATGVSTSNTWNTIGAYTVGLQVTDDDGSASTATAAVTINGATHSISLVPGWNLVAFNLHPQDTSIATVLSSISGKYDLVYAWDGSVSTNNWKKFAPAVPFGNTLTTLDEKMGFWIHMTSAATLNVVGSVPTSTSITLATAGGGWNLVGYPAQGARPLPDALRDHGVGTNYTLVYSYRASETTDPWKLFDRNAPAYANDLPQLTPGWGYWVRVSSDSTWTVVYLP